MSTFMLLTNIILPGAVLAVVYKLVMLMLNC